MDTNVIYNVFGFNYRLSEYIVDIYRGPLGVLYKFGYVLDTAVMMRLDTNVWIRTFLDACAKKKKTCTDRPSCGGGTCRSR